MRRERVTKAGLARHPGWHMPQLDRLLDLRHDSRLDQLEKAFAALKENLPATFDCNRQDRSPWLITKSMKRYT